MEPHSHSRIEYMIKAKSQFKSRSIANNVEIIIPVPSDVDSPSFKASIGTLYSPLPPPLVYGKVMLSFRYGDLFPRPQCDHLDDQAVHRIEGLPDAGSLRTTIYRRRGR